MVDFQVTTRELPDNILALSITGRLDSVASPELEKTFQKLYNQGIYRFIVDLSGVDYLSSTGAGTLLRFLTQVREHKGDMVLYQLSPQVIDILSMLGLAQLIKIVPDRATALKSLPAVRRTGLSKTSVTPSEETGIRKIRIGDLQISTQELPNPVGNIMAISITGRLDSVASSEVEKTFRNFYNQGIYKFIVDLSGLSYLSSAGAGALIRFLGRARAQAGDIILFQSTPQVTEILSMLGLPQLIKIVPDRTAALKSLGQPR